MAQLLRTQGQDDRAFAQIQTAVEKNPNSAEAQLELGKALSARGEYRDAVKTLETAADLNPGSVEVYIQLSLALQGLGNLDRAEIMLNRALRLSQRDEQATRVLVQRGELRSGQGRFGPAIDDFEAAIQRDPRNIQAYIGLGETYRLKGDVEQAISNYKSALLLDDTYADAHVKLGNIYFDTGSLDEAIASYQQAVGLQAENVLYRLLLGDALVLAQRSDDALAAYAAAAGLDATLQTDVAYYLRLSSAYQAAGQLEDALAQAQQAEQAALAAGEAGEGALQAQADILRQQSRWQPAVDLYEQVLALNPQRAEAVRGLALALEAQGRNQEAVLQWRAYLEQAPRGPFADEAREHLRKLRQSSG
jgi:tetratricopeptide (TPR) repeat protein